MIGPNLRTNEKLVRVLVESKDHEDMRTRLLKALIEDVEAEHHMASVLIASDISGENDYTGHLEMLEKLILECRTILEQLTQGEPRA